MPKLERIACPFPKEGLTKRMHEQRRRPMVLREELRKMVAEALAPGRDLIVRFEASEEPCPGRPQELVDAVFVVGVEDAEPEVVVDGVLEGRSSELVEMVVTAAARRAAAFPRVRWDVPKPRDPVLLLPTGSYVGRCPECGMAEAASVPSLAFGGRHLPGRCPSCGVRRVMGKARRDVVVTYAGGLLFEDPDEGLVPVDADSFSRFVLDVSGLSDVAARRAAMADYVAAGGMGPSDAIRVVWESALVDYVDVEEVIVNPWSLRIEDDAGNTQPYIWIEAGPRDEDDGIPIHDPRLNVGGYTLDEALSALAARVSYIDGALERSA